HIARWFGVAQRSVRRWRDGSRRTPRGALIVLRLLAAGAVTLDQVEQAAIPAPAQPKPPAPHPVEPAPAPASAALVRTETTTFTHFASMCACLCGAAPATGAHRPFHLRRRTTSAAECLPVTIPSTWPAHFSSARRRSSR